MSGLSSFYAAAVANHFFRGDSDSTAFTNRPTRLFLSLHTASPTDRGSSNDELTGYLRQPISFDQPVEQLVSTSTTEGQQYKVYMLNSSQLTFVDLPSCRISYIGIWTAQDGGALLFSDSVLGNSATPQDAFLLNTGDTLIIPAGYIKVNIY